VYKLIDMGEIKAIPTGTKRGIRVSEDWLNEYILKKENDWM
jgi:hypothetical protein